MSTADGLAEVDAVFERLHSGGLAPGIGYGVVIDGEVAHVRGVGTLRDGADLRPDGDSVFRIASMTKSFTAAAILLLREAGRLRLDDRAATWVPELTGLRGPTADSPPITIEHLLTMSAGLATDDPWGDRQQGLDFESFADLLRQGGSFAWAPGTRFEYSNLGYGILGLVVSNAAGVDYREFVGKRILQPLGMTATTFELAEVPERRLAVGYVRRDDAWVEEPIDPYGAFASMGGAFSSVRDLVRWVAGFADAFPPRDSPDGHPLSRTSRREMQQVHRSFPPELRRESAESVPALTSGGYGYGLAVSDDLRLGRVVAHGGGYPGYGSQMAWHPASGIGVIALANGRYADMLLPVREAIGALVEHNAAPSRPVKPWPQTSDARMAVERLLERWDETEAATLFAMNVDLDEPLSRRRAELERLRLVHGRLRPDGSVDPEAHSPAHLAWWLSGERGRVRIEILLSPEHTPRIQKLTITSVPEPGDRLQGIAERLAKLLGQPAPSWPSDLALAAPADQTAIDRALRAAEALFGPVSLGPPVAGDGIKEATWRLVGERGELDLQLELDAPGGSLMKVGLVPRTMAGPVHGY